MTLPERFQDAVDRVQRLPKAPAPAAMLELYGLFKQATAGDATGARPGALDFRGRAKFDAWAGRKGMAADAAMEAYIAVVERLERG